MRSSKLARQNGETIKICAHCNSCLMNDPCGDQLSSCHILLLMVKWQSRLWLAVHRQSCYSSASVVTVCRHCHMRQEQEFHRVDVSVFHNTKVQRHFRLFFSPIKGASRNKSWNLLLQCATYTDSNCLASIRILFASKS